MKNIIDLTLKELITDRPDLVQAIKSGEGDDTTTSSTEKDEKGRVKKWTEDHRDIDENLLSKRVDEYSYYETGEVDIITLQVYDNKGTLTSEKKVKHFKDGKKPEVAKNKIKKL